MKKNQIGHKNAKLDISDIFDILAFCIASIQVTSHKCLRFLQLFSRGGRSHPYGETVMCLLVRIWASQAVADIYTRLTGRHECSEAAAGPRYVRGSTSPQTDSLPQPVQEIIS